MTKPERARLRELAAEKRRIAASLREEATFRIKVATLLEEYAAADEARADLEEVSTHRHE